MVLLTTLGVVLALLLGVAAAQLAAATRRGSADAPQRLLNAAVTRLPAARRDWGVAMNAELAHLRGPADRWRFALGASRVALFPPRSGGARPMLTAAGMTGAAALAAGLLVGRTLPVLQVFAVTFVAAVGGYLTLVAGRAGRGPARPAIAVPVLAGVSGCIGVAGYAASVYPAAAGQPLRALSVFFAVLLAGYLWLGLTPPRALTTHRWPVRLGVMVGLGLGVASAVEMSVRYRYDDFPAAWPAALVLFPVCAAVSAALWRSVRAGVQCALWAGVLGTLPLCSGLLLADLYAFRNGPDPSVLRDFQAHRARVGGFDAYLAGEVSDGLAGFIVMLALLPALALLLGMLGAALGRAVRGASPMPPPSPLAR